MVVVPASPVQVSQAGNCVYVVENGIAAVARGSEPDDRPRDGDRSGPYLRGISLRYEKSPDVGLGSSSGK
jgi:hypothetical protein